MNHSKLQDMKRNHLYMILNELYLNDNATINELIKKTDLSQPSIRNMLRSLQKQNIIHEIGCDFSTGGRCPTRFALNTDKFHLLCIFIQNHIAHVHIIYNKQEQAHFHINYQVEVDLIKQIQHIIQQYSIHCCVLSVEGIVQDLTYITDHFNSLEKHSWVQTLKDSIDIPVCLQNDVKAMHYGQYLNHPVTPSFYLHINELGIGGSYMAHNELLNGQNGISSEIGLIPYNGKPLNLAIRECRHQEQFNELLRFLLTIIISTYDPAFIHISIDNQWNTESLTLKDYLLHLFPLKIENQIIYHQEFMNLMFDGLQYIGIQCLLNKIIQGEEK